MQPYDLFLSYSWADTALADRFVAALQGTGLSVFRDSTGMEDFDDIGDEITAALAASRSLVALYTKSFPASAYCRFELYQALDAAYRLDGHAGRVMAAVRGGVTYEDVRPRILQDARLPVKDATVEALATSVAARLEKHIDQRTFGSAQERPAPRWYPSAAAGTGFVGRETELWDVRDALVGSDPASRPGRPVAHIVGVGGQGKTMLAEQYARWFAADHRGGVFILRGLGGTGEERGSAALLESLRDRQLLALATAFGEQAPPADADGAWAVETLKRRLTEAGQPYLWILDDLPSGISQSMFRTLMAPTELGRTLVTARHDSSRYGGAAIPLEPLDRRAAIRLLLGGPTEDRELRNAAGRLAEAVGFHALALALTAGMLTGPGLAELERFEQQLSQLGPDVLELAAHLAPALPTEHADGVAATLSHSIEQLDATSRSVLRTASLLAPAPIPQSLLSAALDRAPGSQGAAEVEQGLAQCAARSLARPVGGTQPTWSVHPLVSRTVRFLDLGHREREALRIAVVEALDDLLERSRDAHARRVLTDLLPHVHAVTEALNDPAEQVLLYEAAQIHAELGEEGAAVDGFSRLYEACRTLLGDEAPTTVAALAGLGVAYGLNGQHLRAAELKERAYRILRERLGEDDDDTLTALNNLAQSMDSTGRHAEARELYRGAYVALRRKHGVHHRDSLRALGNFAIATGRTGRHRLALRLKQQVAERYGRLLGPLAPETLDARHNVAASMYALGDRVEARALLLDVYRARCIVLGEAHPESTDALENAAICESEELREAALRQVYLDRLRYEDPGSVGTRRTLALVVGSATGSSTDVGLSVLAPVADIVPPYLEASKIHLDDETTDERAAAFELAEEVFAERSGRLGDEHPDTLFAELCLGHATVDLRQFDEQVDMGLAVLRDAEEGMRAGEVPLEILDAAARLVEWAEALSPL